MKKAKLIELLEIFSQREFIKLEEMLQSPYFNKDENCLFLFRHIKEEVLDKQVAWNKDKAHKALFPNNVKQDNKLNRLMSVLYGFAKEVLVQEQLRLQQDEWNKLLCKGLEEKGKQEMTTKLGEACLKKIQSQKKPTKEDYQAIYEWTSILNDIQITTERSKKQRPQKVLEVLNNLDAFYLSHRLPLMYEFTNLSTLMAANIQDTLAVPILELSKTLPIEHTHLIHLYRLAVLTVKQPEETTHFYTLVKDLELWGNFIPKQELHALFTMAGNYCIQQIFWGNLEFKQDLFDIYKKTIDHKALFITKYLPPEHLKNIIALSCQLGELDWAHSFLEDHWNYLEPSIREVKYDYYRATILFYQKDFEKASNLLYPLKSSDLFFELGRRFFLLKIYYELKHELLEAELNNFIAFIRSNKTFNNNIKAPYNNFARTLKALNKLRQDPNATLHDYQKLRQKLESYKEMSNKKWLLEKFEELTKNK